MNGALPVPLAMRFDEITEQDLAAIQEAAKTMPEIVRQLRQTPYRIPEREVIVSR